MSVCEMIELANRIVKGEQVKTPAIEAWIIAKSFGGRITGIML